VDLSLVGGDTPLTLLFLKVGFALSFMLLPLSIGVAVLRSHLFDIDLVINRTLVYGSLTAILIVLYFGGIVVLQGVFDILTGASEKSTLTVVVSTPVIAALFIPLRRRIQSFIDKRFYRKKYDARKTLEDFSATLRDETDLKCSERRSGGSGQGEDAARARHFVAAARHSPQGPAGRLASAPQALLSITASDSILACL
jgi:hypothetical protein